MARMDTGSQHGMRGEPQRYYVSRQAHIERTSNVQVAGFSSVRVAFIFMRLEDAK